MATSVRSLRRVVGDASSHAKPATTTATAASRTASPPRAGSSAAQTRGRQRGRSGCHDPPRRQADLRGLRRRAGPAVRRERRVVRDDEHGRTAAPPPPRARRRAAAFRSGSTPRVGSSRIEHVRPGDRRPRRRRAARARRSKGRADAGPPPSRARRVPAPRVRGARSPPTPSADLVERRLANEVAAGILREVRDAARALDRAAVRLEQARGELRERRLAGAVRRPRARRSHRGATAETRRRRARAGRRRTRTRRRRPAAPRLAPSAGAASAVRASRASPAARPRARRPPRRAARRAAAGRLRRTARGRPARAPARRAARRARRPRLERRDGARGSASPPSGSSCEVGSSSSSSRGRSASAAARQTRCSSPPESSIVATAPEVERADRLERLLDPRPRSRAARTPRFSSPNATSFSTRVITTWSSGILEDGRDRAGELGRAGARRVSWPADLDPAGEAAAVEVRHEPGERAESVDFPEPEGPSSATTSPGSSSSETSRSASAAPG